MEEDIKILENFKNETILYGGRIALTGTQKERINIAIENLIKGYRELETNNYEQNNIINEYIEENKCLYCGKNAAGYCEECYQELIGTNAKLQLANKNISNFKVHIEGMRSGKQLLERYINDSILKSEIRIKLAAAEAKIKGYNAARGSGKTTQELVDKVELITEIKIYRELLEEEQWQENVVCVDHIKRRQNIDIWKSKKDIIVIVEIVKEYTTKNTREYIEKGKGGNKMDLDDEELKATRKLNGSDKNVGSIEVRRIYKN